jgi:hypothetical protein
MGHAIRTGRDTVELNTEEHGISMGHTIRTGMGHRYETPYQNWYGTGIWNTLSKLVCEHCAAN